MIHISLSPNLEKEDVREAILGLVSVWGYKYSRSKESLKTALGIYFNSQNIYLLNSGRSSLLIILRALGVERDDEIILQSFTCNAVANPIRWAGAKPVYTDIDHTFNIDPKKIEEKITAHTRAIIVQHTFGIPARIDEILKIARNHNLVVIEDCAHALGAKYKGKKVGTYADVSFFSFGRDKVISSVYGGAILVNDIYLNKKIKEEYRLLSQPSYIWILRQLCHPPLTYFALLTYKVGGKYFLYLIQQLGIVSLAVTQSERNGGRPGYFPRLLPAALEALAMRQFKKLKRFNDHRRRLAKIYEDGLKDNSKFKIVANYDEGSIFLRYPVLHRSARDIQEKAKIQGIILGDWYREVIAPKGTDMETMSYTFGSTPNAEYIAPYILNLPTNIRTSEQDAKRIVLFLQNYSHKD